MLFILLLLSLFAVVIIVVVNAMYRKRPPEQIHTECTWGESIQHPTLFSLPEKILQWFNPGTFSLLLKMLYGINKHPHTCFAN